MGGPTFDYIVVGAGINGTWSAYHLSKRGYKVLLLDQVSTQMITKIGYFRVTRKVNSYERILQSSTLSSQYSFSFPCRILEVARMARLEASEKRILNISMRK